MERGGEYFVLFSTTTYAPEVPTEFPQDSFQEVTWAMRSQLLAQSRQRNCNEFFETCRACVLTLRYALEWPALRELLDLSLKELTGSSFGDILSLRAFFAQSSAPRLGSMLKR